MSGGAIPGRLVKGTGLVDILKLVRHVRKQRRFAPLRQDAEALLAEHIMPSAWYSHEAFLVLIQFAFETVLGGSEQKAYDMGAAGGRTQLQGPHKAFVDPKDPFSGAWAMRHMWRLNFSFGELRAERDGASLTYSLSGYRDVPPSHAYMVAGWVRAGVQLSGARKAAVDIYEKPWLGAPNLSWRVTIPSVPA